MKQHYDSTSVIIKSKNNKDFNIKWLEDKSDKLLVRENPNTDEVKLNLYAASEQIKGITERTYQRGLRELLDKQFLYRSPYDDVFFVNIRYMFNGDRLAFVKAYHLKGSKGKQRKLPTAL